MRKTLRAAAVLLTCACSAMMQAQTAYPDYQDGKIWFKLKDDYRVAASLSDNNQQLPVNSLPFLNGISRHHQVTGLSLPFAAAKNSQILKRTYLLRFSDYANVDQIISELRATGAIEYAERVPLDKITLTPNDPSYSSQWHLSVIGAATAWNSFSTGSNIRIAIIDNAVDRTHPDLIPNLWTNTGEIASNGIDDDGNGYIDDINGYDVSDNDNNPNPPNATFDHGTHVAGISSASTNNGVGVASIGYSCKLMCIKAAPSSSSGNSITNGYDGVVYAVNSGADVINMSWGGSSNSTTAQNIITWASNQGVILVAAAGNSNVNTMFYPAGYTECIAVAATNSNDTKASFSNFGSWVDISAPGNNIYSTLPGNPTPTYGNMSGTSMASPLVAGLCGLMLSLNPGLTPSDVRSCLTSTATNINAMNSSYIGQLGSGRINAAAAMSCIAATLNWPPQANFTANVTTVTAGGQVQFTNQSVYNPTSWSWSFPGGTPATYNGQNPPAITYSTPGLYNVSLTVSNTNGSDTQTNTNYINVTAASGCTKINLPAPSGWTPVNYYTGTAVGQDGWINGLNVYADKEKAMYFDASTSPYTQLVNVWVAFGRAYSATASKIVPMRIYDGTSGIPGAQIGTTVNATMGQIMQDEAGGYYTEYSFVNTPVTLPASKKFFVSLDMTNLNWPTAHDTLSIVSNSAGQTTPSAIWEKQSDNLWYQYTTAGSWNLSASLYVHPFLTGANSVATFTQSATSICQGSTINFDATGSTFEDTLLWYFDGGTPVLSNNVVESTIYNTPGNYQAILYVIGGGCHLFDSAFVNITVNANPSVAVTATPTTLCSGGSTTLTASGANSYVWSPNVNLSSTTGATVTATPPNTINYTVVGTAANGCTNSSNVQIDVLNLPVASIIESDTNICMNQPIVFDGSNSTDATSFTWSMPGGTPSSSSASSPSTSYGTVGSYTATLIVTNQCGADTTSSITINVGCLGIDPVAAEPNTVNAFFNANAHLIDLSMFNMEAGRYELRLVNALGQLMYSNVISTSGDAHQLISTQGMAPGAYLLQVSGGKTNAVKKLIVQ